MDNTILIEAYQVTGEDDPCAVVNEVLDGWDGGADAGVVGDVLVVVQGHIEIGTEEHFLPLQIRLRQVANALLGRHSLLKPAPDPIQKSWQRRSSACQFNRK